jgi:predicted ATPase
LRRLQRRVAEEAIPSDKVNLYFCRMDNGASKIENLELDEDGYIKNWPHNFFGDDMGDLIAMTEATIKRKEANT